MRAEALQRILHPTGLSGSGPSAPGASREQAALRIRTGAEWEQQARVPRAWSYRACAGRLIELSGTQAAPLLTLAFALVLDAQRAGEPVVWLQRAGSTFFPPDAARNGIDLASLVVVRIPDPPLPAPPAPARGSEAQGPDGPGSGLPGNGVSGSGGSSAGGPGPGRPLPRAATVARAAARLLRSGAFGLVVLDLGSDTGISAALLGKLGQLAQRHDSAVCCLTVKRPERPSLGSLVSLRGEALRRRTGEDRFSCVVRVLKDKRSGPGWTHEEVVHGMPGLS